MKAFTDFILQVVYPPNPSRQLNNALRTDAADRGKDEDLGRQVFFRVPGPDPRGCEGLLHTLNRAQGFFGTDGLSTFEGETQEFKIAHLRNVYQKVGMFGMAPASIFLPGDNAQRGRKYGVSGSPTMGASIPCSASSTRWYSGTSMQPSPQAHGDSATVRASTGDHAAGLRSP